MRQKRVPNKNGNQDVEREREQAKRGHQDDQVADRGRVAHIGKALQRAVPNAAQGIVGLEGVSARSTGGSSNQQEAGDDGQREDGISHKGNADGKDDFEQQAGNRRPERTGRIENAGIEGNRAR